MSFISLAVVCLKAIHPARLWCKTPSPILLMAGLLGVGAVLGLAGKADADIIGTLKVYNCSGVQESGARLQHRNDVGVLEAPNDPYDSDKEFELNNLPSNSFEIYILNNSSRMYRDARPENSTSVTDFKLVYNGTTSQSLDNWLRLEFGTTSFGSTPITLQTPTGDRYDIREIIDGTLGGTLNPSAGIFNLPDLSAGTYNVTSPYATYVVDFDPVPEPATLALLGLGAATLIAGGRRKRKRAE